MDLEQVKNLIHNSEEISKIQKSMFTGFIERAEHDHKVLLFNRDLIEKVGMLSQQYLSDIVVSTDEVKIYTITGKSEFDIKYHYRNIFLNNKGHWERCNTASPTLETAMLAYFETKYLGSNSQFAEFAMKMLGIKIED